MVIAENLNNLKVALEDSEFLKFSKQRYDRLKDNIEKSKAEAFGKSDLEFTRHIKELDKYNLRTEEWRMEPLENPEHNFVGELFDRYLADLYKREKTATSKNPTPCELLRKMVTHEAINDQINALEFDNKTQIEKAIKKEAALRKEKERREVTKRCSRIARTKVDFVKGRAFKRVNSFKVVQDYFPEDM